MNFLPKIKQRQDWGNCQGSSLSLMIAQIAQNVPLLVLTPDPLSAQRLCEDAQFFAPQLPHFIFRDWETLPYDIFSPHQEITSERLAVLYQLPDLKQGFIFLSITTLMHPVPPVEYVKNASFSITCGETLNQIALKQTLENSGYTPQSQVQSQGEYALRQTLIDIFPMGSDSAYRIDFKDEKTHSIRPFDANTEAQLSQKSVKIVTILPAREYPLNQSVITNFRERWLTQFGNDAMHSPIFQSINQKTTAAGIEYYLPLFFEKIHTLFDYLPANTIILTLSQVIEKAEHFWHEIIGRYEKLRFDKEHPALPPTQLFLQVNQIFAHIQHYTHLHVTHEKTNKKNGLNCPLLPLPELLANHSATKPLAILKDFLHTFQGRILITAETMGRREHLLELLKNQSIIPKLMDNWQAFLKSTERLCIAVAPLEQGFIIENTAISVSSPKEKQEILPFEKAEKYWLCILPESHILGAKIQQSQTSIKSDSDTIVRHLSELHIGTPVVHEEHGVGRYRGLTVLQIDEIPAEFLHIEYANSAKLYVPIASLHLIHRFTGVDSEHLPLHQLGSKHWEKAKNKAKQEITDIAVELLAIHAKRATKQGFAFKKDNELYQLFAQGFPFEETPDQQTAIDAVLQDMMSSRPMDRLVCGDVGFGKTEVAMRAAFMAVQNNQQVAVLVPTTLLTQQHFQTFQDRFADFPVRIAELSRFSTAKEQNETIHNIAEGKIDIVIGTHKLLQKTIKFKSLGLIILDEEHRFGVQQKEQLKSLRAEVDILTLTATPIPRSLSMAFSNLRDLSVIATPPSRRLPVKTFVGEWHNPTLTEALLRELRRGGQVYFLHNEVETIEKMAKTVVELVPEARVQIAHGKMRGRDLERVMQDFYHRRFNILICTTIIESGIDVPNANTIIIHRADKFGLAQLHQLRGRVGRSHHRAYAYLLTPPYKLLTPDALKRLNAISNLEELGSGFTLATNDLEIRGAGELLGKAQSGHIQEIGYTLYTELLQQAMDSLQSGKISDLSASARHAEINLHCPTLLPSDYLPDVHIRLILYKRIANALNIQDLKDIEIEMIDRFGLLPLYAKYLFLNTKLKIQAVALGIQKIEVSEEGGYILFTEKPTIDPLKIVKLIQTQHFRYRLEGPRTLKLIESLPDCENRYQVIDNLLNYLK